MKCSFHSIHKGVNPMPINLSMAGDATAKAITRAIKEDGLCLFEGLPSEKLLWLAHQIGTIVYHPDANESGITHIYPDESKVVGVVGGAFSHKLLPLHTDGKGVSQCSATIRDGTVRSGPADFILLQVLEVDDPVSAASTFCDGRMLYDALSKKDPALCAFLKSPEAILKYTTQPDFTYSGPLFHETQAGVTLRFNCVESKNWPRGYLRRFCKAADELTFKVSLGAGQGFVVDNRRMLHGRGPIPWGSRRTAQHIVVYTCPDAPMGRHLPIYSL
ncbi:MAG: TauD/TfdA family dioxygenase [Patescibacteria group bacterium]